VPAVDQAVVTKHRCEDPCLIPHLFLEIHRQTKLSRDVLRRKQVFALCAELCHTFYTSFKDNLKPILNSDLKNVTKQFLSYGFYLFYSCISCKYALYSSATDPTAVM
jgi:hypothetical protein